MIQVFINGIDKTDQLVTDSLTVEQILGAQRDTAKFAYKKYGTKSYTPVILDDVLVYDGTSKIFGGKIIRISEKFFNGADGLVFTIECVDYSFDLDSMLVSKTYSSMTVNDIIADIISNFTSGFTGTNVDCNITISKIVFNLVTVTQCLKRLADMVKYDWYIDPDKDLHFFSKYTYSAPYNLTDISGNYIVNSLERKIDGTQIANSVIVRGGEYNTGSFEDVITVNGNTQSTFKLPYKFANLTVQLDTGAGYVSKTVGIDFVDDFTSKDVLYNYNDQTIKFVSALADGNKIKFSGNPKARVLAIATDDNSVTEFGLKEKLIEDSTIEDLDTARKRAVGELAAFKDQQSEARFITNTEGLRSGMIINLTSSRRSSNTDFIIRSIKFKPHTPNNYIYDVELVTTKKYNLTELLQSILQPSSFQSSESETTETIKTDISTITITENITNNSPILDTATITITENIQKDPLGTGVQPTWVLGDYFPSSPSDTKRMGLLDRSMRLY